jgi:hypothetical protein
MPKTGEKAPLAGHYSSDCCNGSVEMKAAGNEFPPCSGCQKPATYTYVGP